MRFVSLLLASSCAVFAAGCTGARVGVAVPVGIGGVGVSVGSDGTIGGSVGVGRGGVGVGVGGTMSLPRRDRSQDAPATPVSSPANP
ncbi:hypothetical protein IS481_10020 [Caldimonas thermodepolymerans]|jgi:hypothetical protein|uniref:Uncharacterized protein n=1 Tax=Caldimonas thermodepolymerans TaxID=215580 RepID=A0AA46DD80_9BURK|nr:hypothetical protein [Caldimonas thermodepolymerans]QPC30146.1 hypothetical protein IS481_10020 [Caldimonas thermodepolymerans]RDI00527.1 hypothetical protein DES46_10490 [Caldimonas thermodepolymerans]TCP07194.1 hypothetical protein EV676_105217 [Caldimonas thermodepolymerans]UZG42901.1 hypothetical protein ONZ46_10715 [Caldimonas thermodepolymerans]UZG46566.1 hypothetical protein ONS87_11365 [Caldimonas thermodepolymerans]